MTEANRAALQAALGHSFREPRWLERALTHRSSRAGELGDNERLEFLGDAVLSLVVSEYLLAAFPAWDEGTLSKSRARLVNAVALARAAQRLDLGRHLRLGRGEEKTGVRERRGVLADAYEAVVAAIYQDAGLEAATAFVRRTLLDQAVREHGQALGQQDYKSALQEWLHARGAPAAKYRVARESGPDHKKRFVIEVSAQGESLATAEGSTKKEAEQAAARRALGRLANRVESDRGPQ
jgi:ribonuclease-3